MKLEDTVKTLEFTVTTLSDDLEKLKKKKLMNPSKKNIDELGKAGNSKMGIRERQT